MRSGPVLVLSLFTLCAGACALDLLPEDAVVNAGTFVPGGALSEGRAGHTATRLANGKVLIAGGYGEEPSLLTAALYDRVSDTFTPTGSMQIARVGHTATLLNDGRVLIVGGDLSANTSPAELYDPETGAFALAGFPAAPRLSHSATLLSDGRVLLAGGRQTEGDEFDPTSGITSAEIYDPSTEVFTATGSLNTARSGHTATLLLDGRVLIAAGAQKEDQTAELYDPQTGSFTSTGSMTQDRFGHEAVRLEDGKVLIISHGYRPHAAADLASAEVYDPMWGWFTSVHSSAPALGGGRAALLADGRVLVVGGEGRCGLTCEESISAAAIFDASTRRLAEATPMLTGRFGHTATLLESGEVLIVGGIQLLHSTMLTDTEIFQPLP